MTTVDSYVPEVIVEDLIAVVLEPLEKAGGEAFVRLEYRPAQPLIATMVFNGQATWDFARDLLRDGLLIAVGTGDVSVSPHTLRDWLLLRRNTEEGSMLFRIKRAPVERWVRRVYSLVPSDGARETQTLEAAVDQLIANCLRTGADGAR